MIRQFSAGGIVYKQTDEGKLWLVRKPKANPGYRGKLGWTFPKGWIDKGETTEEAAVREVAEEGGVKAKILKKLPTIKIFFTDKGEKVMKFITYFLMEWEKDLPEGHDEETEEVQWLSLEKAGEMLAYSSEKKLLEINEK